MARHPFDALSFLFGLLFALVGLALLAGNPARGTFALDWVGPIVAASLGLVILFAARRPSTSEAEPASSPAEIEL